MFLNTHMRPEIKKSNPSAGWAEVSRIAAERWNEMSDAEKQPYIAFHDVEQV
jgi:hypothetical protein